MLSALPDTPSLTRCSSSAAIPAQGDRKWRAQVRDLDFRGGFVTLRERKRSRDTKTTRRVPMSGLFKRVMRGWVKGRTAVNPADSTVEYLTGTNSLGGAGK
jgi:hypothetical protein